MTSLDARLDVLRGPSPALPHTARTLAALTTNPGCDRRALLDAAGIDKDALASHLGTPSPLRASPLALRHGAAFAHQVTAQGGAELVRLLRETLGLTLSEVSYQDLAAGIGDQGPALSKRYAHTRALILGTAHGSSPACTLVDHPVLRLTVAGHQAYLEPDTVAFHHDGAFHIVEIKSFPVIDGAADSARVAAALTQAAAHVLALRELLAAAGLPPGRVSDLVVLVTPLNFSTRPTATLVNAHQQIKSLSRHLGRLHRLPELLDQLPPTTTFDLAAGPDKILTRPRGELAAALAATAPRYTPGCRHYCDLALHCRGEARRQGRTETLGTEVREDTAGIETIATALALTDGHLHPSRDRAEVTSALRHAQRVHDDLLAGIG